jgi:hypothetical protein
MKSYEQLEKQNKALTELCLKLLDIMETDIDEIDAETVNEDSFVMINKKSFRCECGCNVFRKLVVDKTKYKCNACEIVYQSE